MKSSLLLMAFVLGMAGAGPAFAGGLFYTGPWPSACQSINQILVDNCTPSGCRESRNPNFVACLNANGVAVADQTWTGDQSVQTNQATYDPVVTREYILWRGSADLTPCSKVIKDDFGLPLGGIKTAAQTFEVQISVVLNSPQSILNKVRSAAIDCVNVSLVPAAVVAYKTGALDQTYAAWKASFMACVTAKSVVSYVADVPIRADSHCHW